MMMPPGLVDGLTGGLQWVLANPVEAEAPGS